MGIRGQEQGRSCEASGKLNNVREFIQMGCEAGEPGKGPWIHKVKSEREPLAGTKKPPVLQHVGGDRDAPGQKASWEVAE